MDQPQGLIRRIAWYEVFPWLILLRVFRIAIAPTLLALASAAVIVMPVGWWLGGRLFLSEEERTLLIVPGANNSYLKKDVPPAPGVYFPSATTGVLDAYFELAEPFRRIFAYPLTPGRAAFYLFGALWTLAIWAFPGAFITRRAIVQLATDAAPDVRSTATYACRRFLSYCAAPLYPLLGIVLLAIPIALLGLFPRVLPGFGILVTGVLWVLVVLAGIVAMWLFGGLLFGWPLMWPTISAERDGDSFEAFSRSYSYVYGKPLHYFFYVVVAATLGALGWAVVLVAAHLVQEFGFWALACGAGVTKTSELRQALGLEPVVGEVPIYGRAWIAGVRLIGLMLALIQTVKTAFAFTYFFAAASAIYLLLRYDVDQKEMDEVYLEGEQALTKPAVQPAEIAGGATAPARETGPDR